MKQVNRSQQWVWIYLGALAILLVWGVVVTDLLPVVTGNAHLPSWLTDENNAAEWGDHLLLGRILSPWLRWDTIFYLSIARDGYQIDPASVAFPPLYPVLIRILGRLSGGYYLLSSLLISWLSCFGACWLLVERYQHEYGPRSASKVIQRILFFPVGFFFFAGYTESLFLLIVLLAWREADRGRWWWAGLIGAAAVMARFVGVFLLVPFGWIWLQQYLNHRVKFLSCLWLMPIPAVFWGWRWFASQFFILGPSEALNLWALHFDFPWVGIIGNLKAIFSQPVSEVFFAYVDLIIVIFVSWAVFVLLRGKKTAEALFVLAILLISLMKVSDYGILGSTGRYLLPLFPVFIHESIWPDHPVWGRVIIYGSILLWMFSSAMFFTWNWIG